MATWAEFEASDPELASFGRVLMRVDDSGIGLAYLATVRRDGGPRVHPVKVLIDDGRAFLIMPHSSPKSADLRREARYMLHSPHRDDHAEFSFRGTVRLAGSDGRAIAARSATAAEGLLPDEDVFEIHIERADTTVWERTGTDDVRPKRRKWTAS